MSDPTTLEALVADETKIADAVSNTETRIKALRADLPELKAKETQKLDAYKADVAAGRKSVYPTAEIDAVKQAEDEIAALEGSLAKLNDQLTSSRKLTKAAEDKALNEEDYADLRALCEALKPALEINNRMRERHNRIGGRHRSLALPFLTDDLLTGLLTFHEKQTTTVKPKQTLGNKMVLFLKHPNDGAAPMRQFRLSTYQTGDRASFPASLANLLIDNGYAVPVES